MCTNKKVCRTATFKDVLGKNWSFHVLVGARGTQPDLREEKYAQIPHVDSKIEFRYDMCSMTLHVLAK